jgi:predicted nucleic acid-binding protein
VSGWLLDTNVLSELRRKHPDKKVVAFVASQPLDSLYVSSVTFAEIRFGIELATDPAKRADLLHWLNHKLRPMFVQRVLDVSEDVMLTWRLMVEQGRKSGHTHSQPDLIIAAIARQHGLVVVTRDTSEYRRAKVAVFDPWRDGSI